MDQRLAFHLFASCCLAAAIPGCMRSAGGPRPTVERGVSGQAAPNVDPSRAYLSLAQIEPLVERPAQGRTIGQLSERAAQQVSAARRLVQQQRYTEAGMELERGLRYDPDHPMILRELGLLHWHAGNVERAKGQVSLALASNADDAAAHYVLGRCAAHLGDNIAATTAYRTALLCGDFGGDAEIAALCHYHLAETLRAEGYLAASLAQYEAFEARASAVGGSAADPELRTLFKANRGGAAVAKSAVLELLGRFDQAAEMLAPLVKTSNDRALSLRYAGLLAQAGRVDEALRVVSTIEADDPEVIGVMVSLHERKGSPEGAVADLLGRISRRPDEPQLVLSLADLLRRLNREAEARRELASYLDGHADAETVQGALIDMLVAQEDWEELLNVCAAAIGRRPERTEETERILVNAVSRAGVSAGLSASVARDESPARLYLRGVVAMSAGRVAEAESLLRQVHSGDPAFTPARVALARLYVGHYRYDEALVVAGSRDDVVAEDARLETVLGEVYERLDQLEQAEQHFKAAIQLDRGNTSAMLALAKVYRAADRPLQAERQLQLLLEKDPHHDEGRELLALTYAQQGKMDAATEQVEALKRSSSSATTKARCAALLSVANQLDPSAYRRALRAAMEPGSEDAATWLAVAGSYNEFEQAEAKAAYLKALELQPDHEEALLGVIFAEQRLLEYESAIAHMRALLPRRPNRHAWRLGWIGSSWRVGLLEAYQVVGDYSAALALAQSLEARGDLDDRTRSFYRSSILDSLRSAGHEVEAFNQIKAWADGDPADAVWSLRLAREYIRRNQAPLAVSLIESLHRRDPSDLSLRSELLDTLDAAGRFDQASQRALEWLTDDPDHDDTLGLLVGVLAAAARVDDALELVRNKLLNTRERQRFQDVAVKLLDLAGRHRECVESLETLSDEALQAMRLMAEPPSRRPAGRDTNERAAFRPDESSTQEMLHDRLEQLRPRLAMALLAAKEYREVQERVTTWLEDAADPGQRVRYWVLLASCFQEQGRLPQAADALEQALALEPDNVQLNNDVAYGWIDRGVHMDRAASMTRYAVSRGPRQAAYLDTYGWFLYKSSKFAEARTWLQRAVDAASGADPVILDHLGDTDWQLNRPQEAIEQWRRAGVAVRDRGEAELSADERRVGDLVPAKIEAALAGRRPAVAPPAASEAARDESAPDAAGGQG